ncbi:MAG: TlpA family protein disulfide reductase [Lachnospiraceae bacterium]|nr:TlpA family protein disulfide reductase [Lachnospiraceae bacterium]
MITRKNEHKGFFLRPAAFAAIILLLTAGCGNSKGPSQYDGLTSLNSFTAATLDGNEFTEKNFSDYDVTIINVWSTTCGPCINEMPHLAEYQKNLDDNVQMITYCMDGSSKGDKAREILDGSGYEGITLTGGDKDLETFSNEIMYFPTMIFVDRKGNIIGEALIGAPSDFKKAYDVKLSNTFLLLGK